MADIEQLTRAFMAADKAGDTKSAQLLANAIREQTTSQPTVDAPVAAQEAPDTSYSGALRQGYDQAGALVGKGIQSGGELIGNEAVTNYGAEMAARNEAEIEASNYQRPEGADGIISNLREGDYANAGRSLAYGAAEAAPQVAGGVVASVGAGLAATTAPIVGTAAALGGTAYGITSALGANRQEKEDQGMDPTATATDLATAVASGLIELTPLKGGGATLKVVREAVQEGAQEGLVIGGNAVQGGEYVGEDVLERMGDAAITGGAIAKGVNVGISTVNKAGKVVFRPKAEVDPETAQAAGDVARIMQEMAETNGFNLKDIDPSSKKGAKEALEQARTVINTEIRTAQKTIKKDLYEGLDDATKSRFEELIASARTKVARNSPIEDIQFVKDNFGETKQGQMLVQSMYKANVTTELSAAGLKGGVSQFTDTFNPIPRIMGGSYNPMGAVAGNLNTGAAIATGGQSLAAQIPLVVGGRAIDAVTGRRSKVNRFVNKNKAQEGLGPVSGIDIEGTAQRRKDALKAKKEAAKQAERDARAAAAQAGRDAREAARQAGRDAKAQAAASKAAEKERLAQLNAERNINDIVNGLPPHRKSPRGTVFKAIEETTGLKVGKDGMTAPEIDALIDKAASIAETTFADDPIISRAFKEYRTHLKTGRMSLEGSPLNSVTAAIKKVITEIDTSIVPAPTKAPKGPPPLSPQAARGKAENEGFLATLRGKMDSDTTISEADRGVLNTAYDALKMNLGKNPLQGAEGIMGTAVAKLSSPSLAETHLAPYIQRVRQQQEGTNAPIQPEPSEPTGNPAPAGPTPVDPAPAPPPGPVLQPAPAKPKPTPKAPTPKEVEKAKPDATAIIEIGKKGSKYENGIQDWDMALDAAKLLGQAVSIFSSNAAMAKRAKVENFASKRKPISRNTAGFFSRVGSKGGAGGTIFSIRPGGSIGGKKRTRMEALSTLLHEIAHGVTMGPMDGKTSDPYMLPRQETSHNNLAKLSGDMYPPGSFVGSAIAPLLSGKNYDVNHPVVQEINNLQRNVSVYLRDNPEDSKGVREFQDIANPNGPIAKEYTKYANSFAEFAVDPVWVYMFDPALAKQVMPETTALIRKEFAKAGNKQIQFYSHPFATILAVVAAMGLSGIGRGDDEEEDQGALMPTPGVLSA